MLFLIIKMINSLMYNCGLDLFYYTLKYLKTLDIYFNKFLGTFYNQILIIYYLFLLLNLTSEV
jgi:hypothetical protein